MRDRPVDQRLTCRIIAISNRCTQVYTFGSADPYVCISAIPAASTEKLAHDSKAKETQRSQSGQWVLPPQGTTKTIKNELNPVFEEDFVIDRTASVDNNSQELNGQDITLFVTVHDWNRTSSDALLGDLDPEP